MKYIQPLIKTISILVFIATALAGIVFFKADVSAIIVYLAFILFFVLLPGALIIEIIGLQGKYLSTTIARSFFAGYALNVALFYLCDLFGTAVPMCFICLALSVWYIARSIVRRNKSTRESVHIRQRLNNIPGSYYLFTAFVFLYSFQTTQFTYISPKFAKYAVMRSDFEFHCGIINSIATDLPVENPWVSGKIMHYHYFVEMLSAIPVKLFNLTSETIVMSCTPYLIAFILPVSLYAFFMEMMKNKRYAGLYCLSLAGANMFMAKGLATSWLMYHLFSNINSAGLGISGLLVGIPLLKYWDDDYATRKDRWKATSLLLIYIMLITGIKGPVGLLLAASLFVTLMLGLFYRKNKVESMIMAILAVIAFLVIYFLVIGASGTNSAGNSLIDIGEVADIFYFKGSLLATLKALGLPGIVVKFALFFFITAGCFMAFLVPFTVGYIRELILVLATRQKVYELSRVTVYAIALAGFIAMMVLDYYGHSQVYFGFVTLTLAPAITFWLFEDLEDVKSWWKTLVKAIFVICMIITSCLTAYHLYEGIGYAESLYQNQNTDRETYRNISQSEYEAMIWLKENTDEDDLIVSDRYYSTSPENYSYTNRWENCHFAYALYSQRDQYLEGSGYSLSSSDNELRREMVEINNQLYDSVKADRGSLARILGVKYVVVSKRFNDVGNLENKDYELCFTNEEVDIYKIKDRE